MLPSFHVNGFKVAVEDVKLVQGPRLPPLRRSPADQQAAPCSKPSTRTGRRAGSRARSDAVGTTVAASLDQRLDARVWHLIPRAAVEITAAGLGRAATPLFKEERDLLGAAALAELPQPLDLHRPVPRP